MHAFSTLHCNLEEIQLDPETKDCKKGLPFGCFDNVCLMVKKIILFKAYFCKQDVETSALALLNLLS